MSRSSVATGRYPSGADWRRHIIGATEQEVVRGIRCASIQRALFDEMRFAPSVDGAVVAMEMTAAAGLISVWLMTMYVIQRQGWRGCRTFGTRSCWRAMTVAHLKRLE